MQDVAMMCESGRVTSNEIASFVDVVATTSVRPLWQGSRKIIRQRNVDRARVTLEPTGSGGLADEPVVLDEKGAGGFRASCEKF